MREEKEKKEIIEKRNELTVNRYSIDEKKLYDTFLRVKTDIY